MSSDISSSPRLLIVSDTDFWLKNGQWYGHGPTVREIEFISNSFEHVRWIVFAKGDTPEKIAKPITSENLTIVPLAAAGGKGMIAKIFLALKLPRYFWMIWRETRKSTAIGVRSPSVPGMIFLFLNSLFGFKKPLWVKYAGNWVNPVPTSYLYQKRLILKLRDGIATVNGNWPDQPKHIHAFWNPCMYNEEFAARSHKSFSAGEGYRFCFVGRLEEKKGVNIILDSLKENGVSDLVESMVWIGTGPLMRTIEETGTQLDMKFIIHGQMSREKLFEVFQECHFLLLPSYSEGFPKVVGEAGALGVIPIVSKISSLPQFIENGQNGFLLEELDSSSLNEIMRSIGTENLDLEGISKNAIQNSRQLTYDRFWEKLRPIWLKELESKMSINEFDKER